MQKQAPIVALKAAFFIVALLLSACGKPRISRPNQQQPSIAKEELTLSEVGEVLVPTFSDQKLKSSQGTKYEEPPKVIRTTQATVQLQRIKMTNVVMKYDQTKRNFSVQGHAFVLDENKKEIADTSFSLAAVHASDDANFRLVNTVADKTTSESKPIVRAKVTCLSIHDNDSIDCSSAVVDFFIAYKKQIYTEQMETQKPAKTKLEVTPENPPPATEPKKENLPTTNDGTSNSDTSVPGQAATDSSHQELQAEKEEDSVQSRYEGTVQTTDFSQEFDQDDEIQTVLKPIPKKETQKKSEPKKEDPKKDQPKKSDLKKADTTKAPDAKPDSSKNDPVSNDLKTQDKNPSATPITQDLGQTDDGDIRPINQAVGWPNKGNLRNATSLLEIQKSLPNSAFNVAFPKKKRFYATFEMAEMIKRMGIKLNTDFNKVLELSDISQLRGGPLSPHLSHQIGMDADIGYPSKSEDSKFPVVVDMKTRSYNPSAYSIEKTYDLLKFTFSQNDLVVDRIFVDRRIKQALCDHAKAKGEINGSDKNLVQQLFKNMEHVDGHGDHFHVRLRCTPNQPACRNKTYQQVDGCS